jgi:hypothetical protein
MTEIKISPGDKNLYNETIEILNDNNLTENDVVWVGNKEFKMSWSEFKDIAFNTWYDSGFGWEYIQLNLLIVGKDWWLERHEYDGSEWWEYKRLPFEPDIQKNSIEIVKIMRR